MTCKQRELQMYTKNRKVYLVIQCKAQLMCTLSLPSSTGRVQTRETNMFFLPVTYICHVSSLQLKQLKRLLSTACLLQLCSNTTSLRGGGGGREGAGGAGGGGGAGGAGAGERAG